MIHLGALPGAEAALPMPSLLESALRDARTLVEAGFEGLVVENFGDAPFFPQQVPSITVSSMPRIVSEIRRIVGDRIRARRPVVLCSHGPVLPDIVSELALAAAAGRDALQKKARAPVRARAGAAGAQDGG